ncbi:outer membrane protein with beta-barrel domain [Dyadobacter jejuensis]|uniref:Outer membrane protein with beta-barrel domain n=1 Tax=Dyadobacter jejuensis TaxID=1082580 RepID=A0A316AH16_9BACT|nr:DUF6089 family protein [Dyadobacter jejuensis]PWJ56942.1 outer membrane protein with beta-barrel domain [Dyadobacter jejuensis]
MKHPRSIVSRFYLFNVYLLLLALIGLPALAQKVELGVGMGGFSYSGDIAPTLQLNNIKPAGSLFFRYNTLKGLSLRAELAGGLIGAKDATSDDPWQQQRNLEFKTRIMEGSLLAEYNFLDFVDKRFAINWTPYVFGGIGMLAFKPNIQTSDYKTSSLILPFGVGVKYQLKRPWGIGLEFGTRKTFTDYLDDLGGEPTTNNKIIQGDPATKDKYHYIRLSITYTFYRIVCP